MKLKAGDKLICRRELPSNNFKIGSIYTIHKITIKNKVKWMHFQFKNGNTTSSPGISEKIFSHHFNILKEERKRKLDEIKNGWTQTKR